MKLYYKAGDYDMQDNNKYILTTNSTGNTNIDITDIWADNTTLPLTIGTKTYPHVDYIDNWHKAKPMVWGDDGCVIPDEYKKELLDHSKKTNLPEGVEMKTLYEVWLVYAENRKKPIIMKKEGIIADNEEDAKIRSGLMKDINDTWDTDYLTVICIEVASVKVKSKPKEVKNV